MACFTFWRICHAAAAPDLAAYRWRLLVQGDSWFSSAPAKINAHANLLQEMVFKQKTCGINCAGASEGLSHLVDLIDAAAAPDFVRLLCGPDAPLWDGLLLSVGGNDLIMAAQTPAYFGTGDGNDMQAVPLHLRLSPPNRMGATVGRRGALFFGGPGWLTFSDYMRANMQHLLGLRDQGPSIGKPVFVHCYAVPMPRPTRRRRTGPRPVGSTRH
ncbi:hypothetical protein ACVBEH_04585 [Roseateles sp. GG27B]